MFDVCILLRGHLRLRRWILAWGILSECPSWIFPTWTIVPLHFSMSEVIFFFQVVAPLCVELLVCVLSGTWCDQSKFSAKQANHAANKVMEIEAHVTQHFSSNRDIWPLKETWQLTYLIFPQWISWSTRLVWITLTPHEWIGREMNRARFKKKKKKWTHRDGKRGFLTLSLGHHHPPQLKPYLFVIACIISQRNNITKYRVITVFPLVRH